MHRLIGFRAHGRFFGPGELRLAVLDLLGEKSSHGYELMTRLEERLGGVYQASAGTIYPTLQQLEDEGLVRVEAADGKKVHHLTADGKRELARQAATVADLWRRAESLGEWGVFRDPNAAEIVGPALRLAKAALKTIVKARGDSAVVDEVRAILDHARLSIERLRRR